MKRLLLTAATILALSGCATQRGGQVIDLTNAKPLAQPQAQQSTPQANDGNTIDFTR